MTDAYDQKYRHINVLNDESFSSDQLRVCHNMALKLFFVNCTATFACKRDMKPLVSKMGRDDAICNGCRKKYARDGYATVLRMDDIDENLDNPLLGEWIAHWLGVETQYVGVSVVE